MINSNSCDTFFTKQAKPSCTACTSFTTSAMDYMQIPPLPVIRLPEFLHRRDELMPEVFRNWLDRQQRTQEEILGDAPPELEAHLEQQQGSVLARARERRNTLQETPAVCSEPELQSSYLQRWREMTELWNESRDAVLGSDDETAGVRPSAVRPEDYFSAPESNRLLGGPLNLPSFGGLNMAWFTRGREETGEAASAATGFQQLFVDGRHPYDFSAAESDVAGESSYEYTDGDEHDPLGVAESVAPPTALLRSPIISPSESSSDDEMDMIGRLNFDGFDRRRFRPPRFRPSWNFHIPSFPVRGNSSDPDTNEDSNTDTAAGATPRATPQPAAVPHRMIAYIQKLCRTSSDEPETEKSLRQKIMEIQSADFSEREKAYMLQTLMTHDYYRLQQAANDSRPTAEASSTDKQPTYHDHELQILGCEHYQRACKLECNECNKWYTCRFCHDNVETHSLVRKDTRNMLCMYCGTAQSAAQDCMSCHKSMATYYCAICKLWDDDPEKSIYHCNDCGICRIGKGLGIDFFHCQRCNACMTMDLHGSHKCIERSTDCDCPICGDYLFTSTTKVIFMPCGHAIHQTCWYDHTRVSYKCPTCAKSILNMEAQFRIMDTEIEHQPLPPPYADWRSIVTCNDCSAKSNVKFHFLGIKCDNCKSYNTNQVKLLKPEDDVVQEVRLQSPEVTEEDAELAILSAVENEQQE